MTVECPRCFTTVLPMKDGICPACRKNLNTSTALSSKMTAVAISVDEELPPFCAMCGKDAGIVGEMGGGWVGRGGDHMYSMKIRLPFCQVCMNSNEVRLMNIDAENYQAKVLVSKAFAEKLKERRASG